MTQPNEKKITKTAITPAQLLEHWQGHRRLTRKTLEAFPEDKLFNYSVGGMRPFSVMILEFIGMAEAGIEGVVTRQWKTPEEFLGYYKNIPLKTKDELLQYWDQITSLIDKQWAEIPAERFQETDLAFGTWEGTIYGIILYWIDNEIHHRGQGYVYLRSLGIEPPYFWERQ